MGINFDFRILTKQEAISLHHKNSIENLLIKISTNFNKVKPSIVKNFWPNWPDAGYTYKGRRFLCYKKRYLVALDGTLLPIKDLNSLKGVFINSGEYTKKILNVQKNNHIDGIPIKNKKVQLIDLNQDILTGLKITDELPILIHTAHKNNISLLEIPDQLVNIKPIVEPKVYKVIVKAAKRIKHTRKIIHNLAKVAFENKNPVGHPTLFITMGGSGSGKSVLKKIADEITNSNLVEASLDRSRYDSLIYKLLIICDHHNDDYKIITQFAHALRDTILNKALSEDYNLIFDGSGIPYKGRYEHLVEIFTYSRYKTYVLAAEAPFYNSKNSNLSLDSYHRILKRFKGKKDHRALPWNIAIQKHALQPRSQFDASHDTNLTRLVIYDTCTKITNWKVLAFTHNISANILKELLTPKNKAKVLKRIILSSKYLFQKDKLNPKYIDFIISAKLPNDNYKILIIMDQNRFIESLRKTLLNINSKGKEDLFFNNLKYLIPAIDLSFKFKTTFDFK